MNIEKFTADQITEQLIAELKKKYKNVFKFKTEDGKVALFRSPSRQEMEAASVLASSNKFLQSNTMLAKATFLGGDECIINDDQYFYGLTEHLKAIIKKVEGELTEL